MTKCRVDECPRPARKSGYCYGHYAQKRKGRLPAGELAPRQRSPRDAVRDAVVHLMGLTSEDDAGTERGWERFWKTAERWKDNVRPYRRRRRRQ